MFDFFKSPKPRVHRCKIHGEVESMGLAATDTYWFCHKCLGEFLVKSFPVEIEGDIHV